MVKAGRTDLEIFPLGLGGNVFGGVVDREASFAILDAFVEGGGNFVDTADSYSFWYPGNRGGESEAVLGAWMRERGNRDRIVVATKVGGLPELKGVAPDVVARAAEASLRRLQTDRIDLYYAHYDQEDLPIEEIARGFDRLVRDGKVRYVAASNFRPERVEAWVRVARDHGLAEPVALQPEYNLVRRAYERTWAPLVERLGLAVFPYFGLASGFLTGKYRSLADTEGRFRGKAVEKHLTPEGLAVLGVMDVVAARHGCTPATVALAWLLAKPTVTAPLASATSPAQVRELLAAASLRLGEDEIEALDRASAPFV